MWLSQLPVLTIGGPVPTREQASRTPSLLAVQNCTSWCRAWPWAPVLAPSSVDRGADEAVAAARNRPDELLLAAGVADRGARRADAAGQRRQRHDPSVPDNLEQLVRADDPVLVHDEMRQKLEDLRLDLHRAASPHQLDPLQVEDAL